MKTYKIFFLTLFALNLLSEDGRLDRDPNNYRYTSLGLHAFNGEDSGIEGKLSLALPGPLYLVARQRLTA